MSDRAVIWNDIIAGPGAERMLNAALENVASGLSKMAGQIIYHTMPEINLLTFDRVTARYNDLEAETVGVYLEIQSGLHGWALLMLPLAFALNLADWVMNKPQGTATGLGQIEKSALAEVGNVTLAYFLNALAVLTHRPEILMPSPPFVMVDMLGAILEVILTPMAASRDDLLIIETNLQDKAEAMQACFWVLPQLAE